MGRQAELASEGPDQLKTAEACFAGEVEKSQGCCRVIVDSIARPPNAGRPCYAVPHRQGRMGAEACDQFQDRGFTSHPVRWLRACCKPKRRVEMTEQGNVPEHGRLEREGRPSALEDVGASRIHDGGFEVKDAPGTRLTPDRLAVVHLAGID